MRNILNSIKKIEKKYIFLIIVIFIFILAFVIYKFIFNEKVQYTVISGYVEKVSENQGLIALDEEVINTENNLTMIPIVEEGKRAFKGNIFAYDETNYLYC